MNILKRYLPFISGLAIFFIARFLILHPDYIYACSLSIIGIAIFSIEYEFIGSSIPAIERMRFMLHMALFMVSGTLLFIFVEQSFFKYLIVILLVVLEFLYLENTYRFLYNTEKYHVSALRNLASYMQVLTLFFISVTLFNVRFFFAVPLSMLVTIGFVATIGLFYVWIWTKRIRDEFPWWLPIFAAALFVEFFVAITFLPNIPLVKGIVTTALSYGMIQISIFSLQEGKLKTHTARTLFIVSLVLLISLATARWF